MKSLNQGAHQSKALVLRSLLRKRRLDAGMSQGELADRVGVTAASICYYESGRRTPSLTTLMKLKSALEFSIRDCIKLIEAIGSGEQENI